MIIMIEQGIMGSEVNSKRRSLPLHPLRGLCGDEKEKEDDDRGEGCVLRKKEWSRIYSNIFYCYKPKVKKGEMCVFTCVRTCATERGNLIQKITIEGQCMSKCGKIQMAHPFRFRLLHHGM